MIRRPPRSTQSRSSAASDVYKRQQRGAAPRARGDQRGLARQGRCEEARAGAVSYTHLRAHETRHDLVCRLLLEKKKKKKTKKKNYNLRKNTKKKRHKRRKTN